MPPKPDPILDDIARQTGLPRETVQQVIYKFSDVALERLRQGQCANVPGLGTLRRQGTEGRRRLGWTSLGGMSEMLD